MKDLYELIEKYEVPVPPEDLATYQVINIVTGQCCDVIMIADSKTSC